MVMLVRAAEEADPGGGLVPLSERAAATRASRDATGAAFLSARATRLIQGLTERWTRADALRTEGALGGSLAGRRKVFSSVLLPVAFLLGLAANELGDDRVVNVLAFPLLGLITWNLAIYVVLFVRRFMLKTGGGALLDAFVSKANPESTGSGPEVEGEAERRFRNMALPNEWPVFLAGVRSTFHLAAALAALGVVVGMYFRGLAVEYRAAFESTFLGEASAQALLDAVLWPASAVTGFTLEVPAVTAPEAAPWLNLYAITAMLAIVVPRLVLAAAARKAVARGRNEAALLPSADWEAYEMTSRRAIEGGGDVVRVIPSSIVPKPRVREAVRALVAERWGGAAMVDFAEPIGYGGEDDFLEALPENPADLIFLMSLTTTPEAESQRVLIDGCVGKCRGGRHVVALDGSGFAERFSTMPEFGRRLAERSAAWHRVLKGAGVDEILVFGIAAPAAWGELPSTEGALR